MKIEDIRADLIAEQNSLDSIVADLSPPEWMTKTSSPGWTVTDQIGHLAYFNGAAATAIRNPTRFAELVTELMSSSDADGASNADSITLGKFRKMLPREQLGAGR